MRKILSAILIMAVSLTAAAQNTISVNVQNLVALDEQFNVTFVIEGESSPSDFQWNAGDDFQLVWGPQKGTSTSLTIVNGNRTKTSQTTYTYVLMPKSTGTFQLQPAVATVKGRQLTSKSVNVEVVFNGQSGQKQNQGNSSGNQESRTGTVSADDLFLKLTLSRTGVMVGETITATLKLYQRVNIAGFEDAKFPAFNGFWSQEVQAPSNIDFHRENIGDKIYNAAVLRSWNLVAQKAGDISIDPAELVCLVNIRAPHASTGSIFDSFFQDDYQTIRKRVTTPAVTVHVSALPGGAPESFTGGVGKYSMSVSLTKGSLKTHEAASLKLTVTGKGNTTLIGAPKISLPPDFEVYDAKTTDINGGKEFEYPFIPRSHGEFDLSPVEFTYYDISSRKYVTLKSEALHLSVDKSGEISGESQNQGSFVPSVNKKGVKDLGSDIRFISTGVPSLVPAGKFFAGSVLFWALAALSVLLSLICYFAFRSVEHRRADIVGNKNRGATKMARKRLSKAGLYLKDNLYTAFYEELHRALLGFVSDKLNMDVSEMSKENISGRLSEKGVPSDTVSDFVGIIDSCEYARYSPDSGHEAMNANYEKAVTVISTIDESMKRKTKPSAASIVAVLLVLFPLSGFADDRASADSLWNAGVNAYSGGNWEEALQNWKDIEDMGLESVELYYNMGNAYFKTGEVASSILYYERALKVDPSYEDAVFNLKFARNQVLDKIEEVPEIYIKVVMRKLRRAVTADAWAVLSLVFLALSLLMTLLFLLGRSSLTRRSGFVTGVVSLIFFVLCLSFSLRQKEEYQRGDFAIVMRAVSSVKSSPGNDSSVDLFVLHEGTRVMILDEVGEWSNIVLADGRQGWMKKSDFEVI